MAEPSELLRVGGDHLVNAISKSFVFVASDHAQGVGKGGMHCYVIKGRRISCCGCLGTSGGSGISAITGRQPLLTGLAISVCECATCVCHDD